MPATVINDQPIPAQPGQTLLEAASQAGIAIPTLCHDPRVTPAGACRMCVVEEVGGRNRLITACSTPTSEGMVVRTDTPRVLAARKLVIELLLTDHPNDCMICEANGNCRLQDYAYQLGVRAPLTRPGQFTEPVDDSSPVIAIDRNKCILCGRCVRACNEIQVHGVLNFGERGHKARIIADFDTMLGESTCVSCGECVSVCPVGALTEKGARSQGRPWELWSVPTICTYCGVGCSLELQVRDGAPSGFVASPFPMASQPPHGPQLGNRIVKVKTNPERGVNRGTLCVKGRFGFDFVHSPDRLTAPLIKRDGRFEESNWEDALSLVAERFTHIRDTHGGDALATLASAKCTNEENYLIQKFTRAVFHTNNMDHCARL